MMTLLDQQIPSIDTAPAERRSSGVVQRLRKLSPTRRTVLRTIAGAGMSIGVGAIGLLPGAKPARAGWWSVWSHWNDCHGYEEWGHGGQPCTPSSWSISSAYCNGAGYHRDDTVRFGCDSENYDVTFTCGARNAWHWDSTEGGVRYRLRCSDGKVIYNYCGATGSFSSICRKPY
jgi:hypothetical protein